MAYSESKRSTANKSINFKNKENYIMARFKIRPYDDYEAWDTAETIEEARDKRSKLAMSFFSRAVVIVDENENEVD